MLLKSNVVYYALLSLLLLVIGGLLYKHWLADDGVKLSGEIQQRVDQRRAQYQQVTRRNERLRLEIEAIKSSKDAIEEMARTKFGLIFDGETYYRFSEQFLDSEQRALKE